MMIKIFLISACVAASAYAGWEWNPNDNDPSGSRIRRMQADPYSHFDFPNIPEMPNFDNVFPFKLKFPDIKIPKLEMPKIEMPEMKFPDLKISPEDIASQKGPGYRVSVVTINGETVITINKDGNVQTFKVRAGSSKEKTAAILAGTVSNN